jgi:hypothetical protein
MELIDEQQHNTKKSPSHGERPAWLAASSFEKNGRKQMTT